MSFREYSILAFILVSAECVDITLAHKPPAITWRKRDLAIFGLESGELDL